MLSDALGSLAPPLRDAGAMSRLWARRTALALAIAAGAGACTAAQASAFTLRLAFPDGQPMTYGSACAGLGCLQRGEGLPTDAQGEVNLPGGTRTIEYRRNGITLGLAPAGVASGAFLSLGDRFTVTLPRLLVGSAPAVDALESDLVARLNEARAARALPLAQINPQLATAADMQANWLATSGATYLDPGSFHAGPFGSDMAFRHGEVSLPEPTGGGEIAEAGGTAEQAVNDWMSSEDHRAQILVPGKLLIGAAKVGPFIIVQTHRPCDGCIQAGTGIRATGPTGPPAPPPVGGPPAPPPAPAPAPTIGSSVAAASTPAPSCGREQLSTRRLRSIGGRVRLRVQARCLRPSAHYTLLVRQGTTGKLLRTVRVSRAGAQTIAVRPSRNATRLGIKLKRDGRAILSRTISLRM